MAATITINAPHCTHKDNAKHTVNLYDADQLTEMVNQPNYGHFAYGTLCLLDSSPTVWSFHLLDTSPTGHFTYKIFCLQDTSPTGLLPTGHFAYLDISCTSFKYVRLVKRSSNFRTSIYKFEFEFGLEAFAI